MSKFDSLQKIAARLKELTEKIYSSKLNKEELEEMENLSRQIYERALILNYKSKEESVFGKTDDQETSTPENEIIAPLKKEPESQKLEIQEEKLAEEEIVAPTEKEPEVEEIKVETPKKEPVYSTGFIQFDFSDDSNVFEEKKTETISEESVQKSSEQLPKEENSENILPKEEKQNVEEKQEISSSSDYNFFLQRFSYSYEAALKDRIGNSKIESIKSALGLNDRLLFIRELFGGETEDFDMAIETLGQFENVGLALDKLSKIAVERGWEKETKTVDQFAQLVNRRYVP